MYEAYARSGHWHADAGASWDLNSNALRPALDVRRRRRAADPARPRPLRRGRGGKIDHALRFSVPKSRKGWVYPARHDESQLTDKRLPQMGMRFRLRRASTSGAIRVRRAFFSRPRAVRDDRVAVGSLRTSTARPTGLELRPAPHDPQAHGRISSSWTRVRWRARRIDVGVCAVPILEGMDRGRNGRTGQSRYSAPPRTPRAVQRAVVIAAGPDEVDLSEMRELLRTAGVAVNDELQQRRPRPDPDRYFGKGKLVELKASSGGRRGPGRLRRRAAAAPGAQPRAGARRAGDRPDRCDPRSGH